MTLTLYYLPESGPCRTVMMTAKILGIDLNLKYLNVLKGEQLTPEFIKINPQHTIPTLTDGDFALWESRCIITYLVDRYGKDDLLYPKDPKRRALINQRLYFDLSSLHDPILCYSRVIYLGSKTFDESKMPAIQKGFEFLNTFLEKNKFVAGNTLTVADIAIISTVATAKAIFDFDIKPYPNVQKWFNMVKEILPDYEGIIEENGKKLRVMVEVMKAKNNSM